MSYAAKVRSGGSARRQKPQPVAIGQDVLRTVSELAEGLMFLQESEGPDAYIKTLRRIGLTNGLTSEQTLRLSDLVGRFYVEGSDVRWLEFQRPELRKLARNGKTRLRLLRTKLKDAQSSIQALLKYLDQIGVEVTLKSEDVLKRGLLVLDPSKLAGADELVSSLPTKGSRGTALLALFDFFSRDCRLERSDAEIRTAAIGNYLWDWKFAVVTTRPKKSDARLGCEAIRKAVARRRSDRDTSPRIR